MIRCMPILLGFLVALTACGGQPTATVPTSVSTVSVPTNTPVASSATNVATATSAPNVQSTDAPVAEVPSVVPSSDANTACAAGLRRFEHEALSGNPVCIPENPQRIAVLDPNMTSVMILQGITPVAHFDMWIATLKDSHPEQIARIDRVMTGSRDIGGPGTVNIEALLATNPDIILTAAHYIEDVKDEIAQIAPVVAYDYITKGSAAEWEEIIQLYGTAINIGDGIESLIESVDARIAALRTSIEEPETKTVSILAYYGGTDPQVLLSSWPVSRIIDDIGLQRPAPQNLSEVEELERYGNPYTVALSMEELPAQDADYLFTIVFDSGDETAAAIQEAVGTMQTNPLWQNLSAVKNGDAHNVGGHWVLGGIYDIHKVLDDLFIHVAGVDPTTVAPNPFLADAPEATTATP